MKPIRVYLPLFVALVATAVVGVLHGRLSDRWGVSTRVADLGQQLESFPEQFAGWQLVESFEVDPDVSRILQCQGYINRRYVHRETGETVSLAVILGPAGTISVHSPEVCYSSRDFNILKDRTQVAISGADGAESTFWLVPFESRGLDGNLMRVYYSWTTDGVWQAANNPRFKFGGQEFLIKLQLAVNLPAGSTMDDEDAGRHFLQDFVPVLKQVMFGTSGNPESHDS